MNPYRVSPVPTCMRCGTNAATMYRAPYRLCQACLWFAWIHSETSAVRIPIPKRRWWHRRQFAVFTFGDILNFAQARRS